MRKIIDLEWTNGVGAMIFNFHEICQENNKFSRNIEKSTIMKASLLEKPLKTCGWRPFGAYVCLNFHVLQRFFICQAILKAPEFREAEEIFFPPHEWY